MSNTPNSTFQDPFSYIATAGLNILPGAKILIGSNTAFKRETIAEIFKAWGIDVQCCYAGDYLAVLRDAPEDTASAEGNAAQKTQGVGEALQNAGFNDGNSFLVTTDIQFELSHPGLQDHPYLSDYRHLYVKGQKFPGTEMALMAQVHGFETLVYDINRALDDIEKKGQESDPNYRVDRSLKATTIVELSAIGNSDMKMTARGSAEYDLLPEPRPGDGEYGLGIFDLDYHVALKGRTESVQEEKVRLARKQWRMEPLISHPKSHNANAFANLFGMVPFPKKDVALPAIIRNLKQASGHKEPARILTDRHMLGTWRADKNDSDEQWLMSYARSGTLELEGYALAKDNDYKVDFPFQEFAHLPGGPITDITGLIPFMEQLDSLIFLPFKPTGNAHIDRKNFLLRQLLFDLRRDCHQLADPHIKGKPDLVLDPEFIQRHVHFMKIGTSNFRIGAAFQIRRNDEESLVEILNRGWQDHEYVKNPASVPQQDDTEISDFVSRHAVALIGNASSTNIQDLEDAEHIAGNLLQAGIATSDGHGAKGCMGGFFKPVYQMLSNEEHAERRGTTTARATLEGDPEGCNEVGARAFIVPHMCHRIMGIYAGTDAVIGLKGGYGSSTETGFGALDNLHRNEAGIEPRPVVLVNRPCRFRGGWIGAYDHILKSWPETAKFMTSIHSVQEAHGAVEFVKHTFEQGLLVDRIPGTRHEEGEYDYPAFWK